APSGPRGCKRTRRVSNRRCRHRSRPGPSGPRTQASKKSTHRRRRWSHRGRHSRRRNWSFPRQSTPRSDLCSRRRQDPNPNLRRQYRDRWRCNGSSRLHRS
ncbi:unnamed protein product, partial [Ectocarpus fasciculatus]